MMIYFEEQNETHNRGLNFFEVVFIFLRPPYDFRYFLNFQTWERMKVENVWLKLRGDNKMNSTS